MSFDQAALDAAKASGVKEGKLELKEVLESITKPEIALVHLVSKPPVLAYGGEVIQHLTQFENYKTVAKIADAIATRVYITYTDEKCQSKLRSLTAPEMDNWAQAKPSIRKILQPTEMRYRSKAALLRTTQRQGESVDSFIDRIQSLADMAYYDDDGMRKKILVDVLLNGLQKEEIMISIVSKHGEDVDYDTACKEAQILGSCFYARNAYKNPQSMD